jgi:hypothetical protein
MTLRTFVERIRTGRANNLIYSSGGKEGLISVWEHESAFVLTWEECPPGQQYNESDYTRDERHVFSTLNELLAFLSANNIKVESFTP